MENTSTTGGLRVEEVDEDDATVLLDPKCKCENSLLIALALVLVVVAMPLLPPPPPLLSSQFSTSIPALTEGTLLLPTLLLLPVAPPSLLLPTTAVDDVPEAVVAVDEVG